MSQNAPSPLLSLVLIPFALIACESDCPQWSFQGDTGIAAESPVQFTVKVCSSGETCSVGSLAAVDGESGSYVELDGDLSASFEVHPSEETASWRYRALVPSDLPGVRFTLVDDTSQTTLVSALLRGTVESCPALTIDLGP